LEQFYEEKKGDVRVFLSLFIENVVVKNMHMID